jgi:purine-cytosine permease-like protein
LGGERMKNKILNHFIGAIDERDEYQKQEIFKELAFSGIIMWYLAIITMGISLVMDTIHETVSPVTIFLFIVIMVYSVLITARIRKKHLDETDCMSQEEYNQKKRKLKKSTTFMGVIFGAGMFVMNDFIFPYLSNEGVSLNKGSLSFIFGGLFFGFFMYAFSKMKLKKHF